MNRPQPSHRSLSPSTRKQLARYALAAAAAGASALALASPASAGIVYQPVGATVNLADPLWAVQLPLNSAIQPASISIDLTRSQFGSSAFLSILRAAGSNDGVDPAMLPAGAQVSAALPLTPLASLVSHLSIHSSLGVVSIMSSFGPWTGGGPGYLGFEFNVGAGEQFGWVGLDVQYPNEAQVTGFAYETTPGVGIEAGERPATAVPEPGTLGLLALGCLGLALLEAKRRAATKGAAR